MAWSYTIRSSERWSVCKSLSANDFPLIYPGRNRNEISYRKKQAFTIVGIKKRVPIIFEGENPEIKAMWENLDKETIGKLKELSNTEPKGLIQASTNFSEGRMKEQGELDHYIGVATTKNTTNNYDQLDVPATSWAVFEVEGPFPDTLQTT